MGPHIMRNSPARNQSPKKHRSFVIRLLGAQNTRHLISFTRRQATHFLKFAVLVLIALFGTAALAFLESFGASTTTAYLIHEAIVVVALVGFAVVCLSEVVEDVVGRWKWLIDFKNR